MQAQRWREPEMCIGKRLYKLTDMLLLIKSTHILNGPTFYWALGEIV